MRTFVITKNGVARIMRTYGLDPITGRVLLDAPDAPDATAIIAKWHLRHTSQVTQTREITEAEVPITLTFRDAWEDDGINIIVNMAKAREIHAASITAAKKVALAALEERETRERLKGDTAAADQAAADRAAVDSLNLTTIAAQIAGAANLTALSAVWPTVLDEFRP